MNLLLFSEVKINRKAAVPDMAHEDKNTHIDLTFRNICGSGSYGVV